MSLAARVVGGLERTSLLGGQETWHALCDEAFHLTGIYSEFLRQRRDVLFKTDHRCSNRDSKSVNLAEIKSVSTPIICGLQSVRPLSTYLM